MQSQKINRVLCINDNEITLFLLKKIIERAQFSREVIAASDGLEALNYCQELLKSAEESFISYPEIIFLDLHMPLMNGWEFLEHYSKHIHPFFKNTKVVITSLSIDGKDAEKVNHYPFIIDFLRNPMTVEYLHELNHKIEEGNLLPS